MNNAENLLKLSSLFVYSTNKEEVIDLTSVDNFSYSAIMREINKNYNDEVIEYFLFLYKKYFDLALENNIQKSEYVALQNTLVEFSKKYKIKIKDSLIKNATITELGSAEDIGQYISNVIKFLMNKISDKSRNKSLEGLKHKLMQLSPNELSNKEMPNSAAIGQAITFVKNILFNHDPSFIKEVLRHVIKNL